MSENTDLKPAFPDHLWQSQSPEEGIKFQGLRQSCPNQLSALLPYHNPPTLLPHITAATLASLLLLKPIETVPQLQDPAPADLFCLECFTGHPLSLPSSLASAPFAPSEGGPS